ncbi:hypothetical protein, partial [Pseudomonas syringae]|uniref:hypothetical protein n=1 Tax=Pseudomonas syringae TaxID=317 RepID=UPI001144A5D3
ACSCRSDRGGDPPCSRRLYPDAENPSTVPASSRTSPLLQETAYSRRSELVREGYIPDAKNPSTVPASSRASSLPQG